MVQTLNPEENKEERLEFLKREEIRTMQKDIARLREIESQKEREKITAIIVEEKIKPPLTRPLERPGKEIPKTEKVPLDTLIPKPPHKKPSSFQKILVRAGVIILFCFLIIGFLYWFFEVRKPTTSPAGGPEVGQPAEEALPPGEEIVERPEIIIPQPLISVQAFRTPEISGIEEIPEIFSQLMKEELPENGFTQVAIKNLSENRLATFEDLSASWRIEVPPEIYQKLEPDFTLSIFNQKQGKRVALIGKVKDKEGLNEILKNWETRIKSEGLSFAGKKIPTLVSSFRTSSYKNVSFRYLTLSKADFGICYAWTSDGYFILTTSFESMKRVIDEIRTTKETELEKLEKEMGQLFIVGFEGKALTPEFETIFKKYRPGGVLLLSKNIENKEQLKSLISQLQDLSLRETGLPLFIAIDQEGEPISRIEFLEEKTAQSAIENIEQAYQIGLKRGEELKELGVNLNLAPVLDIVKEGDFLFSRSFQKDTSETGKLAKALISGQKTAGILTAIKHFPGYGGISSHPEEELAILETYPEISQFEKAMEANPEFVMTSNVIYSEIDSSLPFTFSSAAIQFLKNNVSPDILILSDDLDQNALLEKFSLRDIMVKPLEAGVDVLIFSGYRLPAERGLEEFFKAFRSGEVSREKIEGVISRIIQLKQNLLK